MPERERIADSIKRLSAQLEAARKLAQEIEEIREKERRERGTT